MQVFEKKVKAQIEKYATEWRHSVSIRNIFLLPRQPPYLAGEELKG
jgi:hypothetical protein